MKKINAIILLIGLTTVCFGQVSDDFLDGDFTGNPIWAGSTSQFIVNASKQLQLSNTVAGQSYLSTPFLTNNLDDYEWQVYVKQSFAPSGTNYGRVYLVSDQSDFTQPLHGYYLQFGEALSNDAIELLLQNGTSSTSVCRARPAGIAASFGVRLKVTRDNNGLWKLYVDYSGGTNFILDASGTDATYNNSSFFGVRCTYTVTNAAKFSYDDISIVAPLSPPPPVDTTPPTVSNVMAISNNSISIEFSEAVDVTTSQISSNFSVDHSIGSPQSAVLQPDGKTVVLTFSAIFSNGVQNQLSISNVQDLAGNLMIAVSSPLPPPPDIIPPTVSSVMTISNNSISIEFSEAVDASASQIAANFSVDHSIGNPQTVVLQPDGKTVILTFATNFSNGVQNQLSISSVPDLAGNVMITVSSSFMFFQATPANFKDIILTEIFSDPSPQINLPVQEYVEIYNRSSNPFDLSGWKLSDGTSTATFGNKIILPNQYWIVCASSNATLFSGYGSTIGVSGFPSLNNGGDKLTFREPGNKTIDSVSYDLGWYHDTDKQDGGWSIEIIDLNNSCSEGENWIASEDPSGGTPGNQNSVNANKTDLTGPQLLSLALQSSTRFKLTFNEKMEKDLSAVGFEITPPISLTNKSFVDLSLKEMVIELAQPMELRTFYNLSVSNFHDCSGNIIQPDFSHASFMLPEAADSLDVIVNEILFNPRTGGVDFVEVYNQSPKYINLKNWKMGNMEEGEFTNPKLITVNDFILPPSSYLVFTSDPTILSQQYPQTIQNVLFKAATPSLPDNEGTIVLMSDGNKIIDYFSYSEKMHSPFVKDNEGVSLERISFSESTNDANNWKSANTTASYATPGFINSNSRPESFSDENAVTLDPEIFSPSTPGKDFSRINYKFDQSGKVANIKVLDIDGRLIKTLANNETLAYEGFYRWDGDRDDGSRARLGYYVVWFEVFDDRGTVNIFRKRAIIGK